MPAPTLGTAYQNPALTGFAVNYRNAGYPIQNAIPTIGVAKETGVYYKWTKGDILRDEALPVRPGARAPRGGFSVSTDSYTTLAYKFAWPIPDRIRDNADVAIKAEMGSTRLCMDKILLAKERALSTLLNTSGSWTTNVTITAGSEWDSAGGGDPIKNFDDAMITVQSAIGVSPNIAIFSYKNFRVFARHADVRDYVKYVGGDPAIVTPQAVAAMVGVEKVIIVPTVYVSAVEGNATQTTANIWNNDQVWVGYVPSSPSIMDPSAIYCFGYSTPTVKTYREEAEEQDVVEACENFIPKVTLADAGCLIINVLA